MLPCGQQRGQVDDLEETESQSLQVPTSKRCPVDRRWLGSLAEGIGMNSENAVCEAEMRKVILEVETRPSGLFLLTQAWSLVFTAKVITEGHWFQLLPSDTGSRQIPDPLSQSEPHISLLYLLSTVNTKNFKKAFKKEWNGVVCSLLETTLCLL